MRAAARDVQPRDHWERLAILRVADDLPRQQAELTIAAIAAAQRRAGPPAMVDREAAQRLVEEWAAPWRDTIARLAGPAGGPDAASGWSLARLVLLGDAVRELVYASRSDAPDPQNRP
jgi:glutamate dehydrogenase